MIEPKPVHVPFWLRPDVENVISALCELRHEIEDPTGPKELFMDIDRRRLLTQVKADIRKYLTISQRRQI